MKQWIKEKLNQKIVCRKQGNCEFKIIKDKIKCKKCGTIWEEITQAN